MPSKRKHIAQAEHNKEVADWLINEVARYPEWAIVITFYAALHFVNYYFEAMLGREPDNHVARTSYMYRDPNMKPICKQYSALRDASEDSRYYCKRAELAQARSLFENELAAVEAQVRKVTTSS